MTFTFQPAAAHTLGAMQPARSGHHDGDLAVPEAEVASGGRGLEPIMPRSAGAAARWVLFGLAVCIAPQVRADVPPSPAACRGDTDCTIVSGVGCCGSDCCPTPHAESVAEVRRQQRRCATIDCAEPRCDQPCPAVDPTPLVAVCVRGACQARPAPPPKDLDFCERDQDCVSSSFDGCCGGCCPAPHVAVSRARDEAQRAPCRTMRCAAPDCERRACAQVVPSPIVPVCRGNRCVAERPNLVAPPPVLECRIDADCGVDLSPPQGSACWASPCGCCPAPSAVPVARVRGAPKRNAGQGTPFGLSTGGAPATRCEPCPEPKRAVQALCASGRCVLR